LACSLVGDVLLMLPSERFVPGLASFLLAHVAYVVAFTAGVARDANPAILLPLLLAAAMLLRVLWNGLAGLRGPVLLYAAVIVVMAWSAWARVQTAPGPGALLAAAGATLFMLSDALLALNRFRHPFRSAQAWIMVTYVAAQTLISLSVSIA
ncbi:MAG: lysoplasmalogenase, partial [Steroidobacteraceae bacterium]